MHTRETLLTTLRNRGYIFETLEHPALNTVADAQKFRGPMGGTHIKNLVLKDRQKQLYLVVLEATRALHLQTLRRILGCSQLSFASIDILHDILGVKPGSVSPLALINAPPDAIKLVIDQTVTDQETINVHPLDNRFTTQMRTEDLRDFIIHLGFSTIWLKPENEDDDS